jgi:uncharacterized protein with GYD domain
MPQYILLLTLDLEGREAMVHDPRHLVKAANLTRVEGVEWLGLYGVLGRFDFVSILEAPDNEAAARFSLELGHRAGAHIETMPAVPIGVLGHHEPHMARPTPLGDPAPA